jgi:hypothetical protein
MNLPRRKFFRFAVSVAALPAMSRIARAQAYPTHPVRFIVPYPPGGATDAAARVVGDPPLAFAVDDVARSQSETRTALMSLPRAHSFASD